jgi:hypothetical protein
MEAPDYVLLPVYCVECYRDGVRGRGQRRMKPVKSRSGPRALGLDGSKGYMVTIPPGATLGVCEQGHRVQRPSFNTKRQRVKRAHQPVTVRCTRCFYASQQSSEE